MNMNMKDMFTKKKKKKEKDKTYNLFILIQEHGRTWQPVATCGSRFTHLLVRMGNEQRDIEVENCLPKTRRSEVREC